MASGGRREGAGRPRKAEKYERPINKAEKQIVDRLSANKDGLPGIIDNLLKLADGGFEQVAEHYEAAGTITTGSGEAAALVFPEKAADEMVLVKRVVTVAAPDRVANIYLIDRILGKPTERQEVTGADGGPIEFDDLSDAERAARAAAILDLARARATRQSAAGSEPV